MIFIPKDGIFDSDEQAIISSQPLKCVENVGIVYERPITLFFE